jgi:hypothetical protein
VKGTWRGGSLAGDPEKQVREGELSSLGLQQGFSVQRLRTRQLNTTQLSIEQMRLLRLGSIS